MVAALILGASTRAEISEQTGLEVREVVDAIDRLTAAGLVETVDDTTYVILGQAFELAARTEARPKADTGFPDEPDDRRRVLDSSLRHGRLLRMPAKRSQRLILLDHLAQRFEPGKKYTEKQVNAMLASVDSDTATLRRYLVDEAMLDRDGGLYWRIGGSYRID